MRGLPDKREAGCLHFAAVVCPVQQGLALSAAAVQVARRTVFDELGDMSVHGFPSFNLP